MSSLRVSTKPKDRCKFWNLNKTAPSTRDYIIPLWQTQGSICLLLPVDRDFQYTCWDVSRYELLSVLGWDLPLLLLLPAPCNDPGHSSFYILLHCSFKEGSDLRASAIFQDDSIEKFVKGWFTISGTTRWIFRKLLKLYEQIYYLHAKERAVPLLLTACPCTFLWSIWLWAWLVCRSNLVCLCLYNGKH